MENPKLDFLDKLRKNTKKFVEIVGLQRYKICRVLVPIKMLKATEVLYFFLFKTGVRFGTYLEVLMGFGFTLFYDLIVIYKIRSFFDLLKIQRFIRNSVNSFILQKDEACPFFPLNLMTSLFKEMKLRKMTHEQQIKFIQYMLETIRATKDYIVLSEELFNSIWKVWDLETERTRKC
jgi:hypothetical protein